MSQSPKPAPTTIDRRRLEIRPEEFRDKDRLIQKLLEIQEALVCELDRVQVASPSYQLHQMAPDLASVFTNAWKARAKMVIGDSQEPRDEMRRVFRHVESMFDAFKRLGLTMVDHTGEPFDYGMPVTVIATEPKPGLVRPTMVETIKPTIYWNETIIQYGEVVLGTPAQPTYE